MEIAGSGRDSREIQGGSVGPVCWKPHFRPINPFLVIINKSVSKKREVCMPETS